MNYSDLRKKSIRIFNILKKKLDSDGVELLIEYEEVLTELQKLESGIQ